MSEILKHNDPNEVTTQAGKKKESKYGRLLKAGTMATIAIGAPMLESGCTTSSGILAADRKGAVAFDTTEMKEQPISNNSEKALGRLVDKICQPRHQCVLFKQKSEVGTHGGAANETWVLWDKTTNRNFEMGPLWEHSDVGGPGTLQTTLPSLTVGTAAAAISGFAEYHTAPRYRPDNFNMEVDNSANNSANNSNRNRLENRQFQLQQQQQQQQQQQLLHNRVDNRIHNKVDVHNKIDKRRYYKKVGRCHSHGC